MNFQLLHQVQAVQPKNFDRNPHFYYHQVQAVHPKILNPKLLEFSITPSSSSSTTKKL